VKAASVSSKLDKLGRWLRELVRFDACFQAAHDYEHVFLRARQDLERLTPTSLSECALLVVGCGYHYPDVILFSRLVARSVGIDVLPTYFRDGLWRALRAAMDGDGRLLVRALEATFRHWGYRRYYRHLRELAGIGIAHRSYELLSYDGQQMPFADGSFDVVLSNAVLEHVQDMEALVDELSRVTKTRGLSYHLWHNYYSLSGSHLPESLRRAHPWGHLRGIHTTRGLNALTPAQIRESFSRQFEIVSLQGADWAHRKQDADPEFEYEGAELLTDELAGELAAYPRELLLTRAYLLIARKRG